MKIEKILGQLKKNFISNLDLPATKENPSLENFIRGQLSALDAIQLEISLAEPETTRDSEIFRL